MAEMIPAQVHQDIEDIGKAVNTDAIITPRYGAPFKSIPMIARETVADIVDLRTNKADKTEVDAALQAKVNADDVYSKELTYTKAEVDTTFAAYVGGRKGYTTLALAQADQSNLPANTVVEVTNDPTTSNNGTYQWNGTTLTKSDYDPLAQAKAYVSNTGMASVVGPVMSNINYVTATRTLEFKNTLYVVSGTSQYPLTTPQSVVLSSNTTYRIEYNVSTSLISAVVYNAARTEGSLVVGFVTVTADTLTTSDFAYRVDGAVPVGAPSEYGELLNSFSSRIAFDTVAKTLTMAAAVRVLSAGFTYVPPASVVVPFPATAGAYSLVFNKVTKLYSFKTRSNVAEKNYIVLAYVYFEATTFFPTVRGIERYVIDGVVGENTVQQVFSASLTASSPSSINFDFKNKKLLISAGQARLNYDKTSALLPAVDVSFLSIAVGFWQSVIYNKKTVAFSVKQSNTPLVDGEYVFALIQPSTKSVYGVADYYVDGKPSKKSYPNADFLYTLCDAKPRYEQPTLPEFKTILDGFGTDFTKIYDLYDALVAAYPAYITKSVIGVDGLGNEINSYQFNTAEVGTIGVASNKPKYIIFSGIHGAEKGGIYNTYTAMREICERSSTDATLKALKHSVNFIVVPVCVPTGYILGTRKNHNGVDIARNFPTGWVLGSNPSSETYGGATPADQLETQALVSLLEQNTDALCFTSHHNFSSQAFLLWISARTDAQVNMGKMLILHETLRAKELFSFMPQTDDYYIGYSDKSAVGEYGVGMMYGSGMEASHAHELGMYSTTYECGVVIPQETGALGYSSAFATISAEAFINYLSVSVSNAVDFHNSRLSFYN